MPVSSCSCADRELRSRRSAPRAARWSCSSVAKKSARSRSSMFTKTTRERPSSSARSQTRAVCTSTPIDAADDDERALDDAQRRERVGLEARVAGRVDEVDLAALPLERGRATRRATSGGAARPRPSRRPSLPPLDRCRGGSIAPAWKSIASTSEVLPVPRWPTTATLRIFSGSNCRHRMGESSASVATCSRGNADVARASAGWRGARRREARLEAQDRLRVELRDARLGHAEHLADLAQRQLLVVVERDDELLALGQPRDRLGERLAQLGLRRCAACGLGRLRVLDRVDQRDLVAAAPEIDQSSSSAAIEEREISIRSPRTRRR